MRAEHQNDNRPVATTTDTTTSNAVRNNALTAILANFNTIIDTNWAELLRNDERLRFTSNLLEEKKSHCYKVRQRVGSILTVTAIGQLILMLTSEVFRFTSNARQSRINAIFSYSWSLIILSGFAMMLPLTHKYCSKTSLKTARTLGTLTGGIPVVFSAIKYEKNLPDFDINMRALSTAAAFLVGLTIFAIPIAVERGRRKCCPGQPQRPNNILIQVATR